MAVNGLVGIKATVPIQWKSSNSQLAFVSFFKAEHIWKLVVVHD